MKKILIYIILSSLFLSACSKSSITLKVPEWYELDPVPKENLISGMYYVKTEDENKAEVFYPVHMGTPTYNTPITKVVDPNRVIIYTKDTQKIPKLYKGDKLVYVSAQIPPGIVVWERFKGKGYSIGLSGLYVNNTARVQFEKNPIRCLNYSDIGKQLSVIEDKISIVIETINNEHLNVSKISDIGTIDDLEKEKEYTVEAYVGTNYYKIDTIADAYFFQSWELYASNLFTYTQEGYAEIIVPEGLKPGYYNVNGMGLVCYMGEIEKSDYSNIDLTQPGSLDNPYILLSEALNIIGENIEDYEDMFLEPDPFEDNPKIYENNDDNEYEDFRLVVEVNLSNNSIKPYWHSIPISAKSAALYVYENDDSEYYFNTEYKIDSYEDTFNEENIAYDQKAKKLKIEFEIEKADGTYYQEKRTIDLSKTPNIIFPKGDISYKPSIEIEYSGFNGQMTSIYVNDVETAITGFSNIGKHEINLSPEWNDIKVKTHSPSAVWIWTKGVYYSQYSPIN